MTTKHTPGPWSIEYPLPGDTSHCAKSGCQMAIQAPIGPDVCWIRSFSEWSEMAKANARLIAAAPELLEALENIWDFLAEDDGEGACSPLYQSSIDKVKAAIAKAKGETP